MGYFLKFLHIFEQKKVENVVLRQNKGYICKIIERFYNYAKNYGDDSGRYGNRVVLKKAMIKTTIACFDA